MAVVNELITKFSFTGSTAPLNDFNGQLGGAINLIGKMSASVFALSGLISGFVISTLSAADSVGQLALNSNVGVVALQELGFAASVSGSSTEALYSSITRLSEKIGEAAQKGNEDFQRLGISVRDTSGHVKSADRIMEEISNRFRQMNLSRPEQIGFAQRLGIDPTLIQLLNKTSGEMNALRKTARDLGTVSEEQQAKIINFNDSFTILRFGMDSIAKQASIGLSPAIEEVAKRFTDLLKTNKTLITEGIIRFGNAITETIKALGRMRFVIIGIIGTFAIWQIATIGLGTVLSAVLSPVYLITAGIVALLLIVDDLIVAMSGGKSVIRDFFLEFFGFDIVPFIDEIIKAFEKLGTIIGDIFKAAFALIKGDLKEFEDKIKKAFQGIKDYAKVLFEPIQKLIDKTKGLFGQSNAPNSSERIKSLEPQLISGRNVSNQSSSNVVNQEIKIDIATTDPKAAGESVKDALQSELEYANFQNTRGGR